MKYYLIAGEASGDLHASRLMQELKKQDTEAEFRFYGGDQMQAAGGTMVRHYRKLAYMGFVTVLLHLPTILTNNSTNYITMKDGTTTRLTIEGVYFNNALTISATLTGATFLKSRFKSINCSGAGKAENLTMIHCKVADGLSFTSSSTFSCLNCIIWEPTTTPGEFINCVVKKGSASYYLSNATFKNCIFVGCANSTFDNTNTFFNCVGLNAEQWNLFNSTNSTNQVLSDYSAIFKTCTDGTYSDSETFELTTTAASTYKGTDGRQIGVYGGMMPFNPQPSNPQITNCTVAEKSDANGMLSIDITVQGAQ